MALSPARGTLFCQPALWRLCRTASCGSPQARRKAADLGSVIGFSDSAAGGRGDERGNILGVATDQQLVGHLALATGAALGDRVEDQHLRRAQLVEVRPDPADGVRGPQRV